MFFDFFSVFDFQIVEIAGFAFACFGFFRDYFVLNFCPLAFMETSGRNLTPDKLPAAKRAALFAACEEALGQAVDALRPEWLLGVGAFAASRVAPLAAQRGLRTGAIPHPSPASPAANRGWEAAAEAALVRLGAPLPDNAGLD